jgi:hypothetical protein
MSRAFEIPFSGKIPEEMYIFCLSIMADTLDAENIPDVHRTVELKTNLLDILRARMLEYNTSIADDEGLLHTELTSRRRMAVEVRVGEKRILQKAIDRVDAWVTAPPAKRARTR